MNTKGDVVQSAMDAEADVPAAITPARQFYWSVRREFWENRSIYLAPLVVGAVFLLGFLIGLRHFPRQMHEASLLDTVGYRNAIASPYDFISALMMLTAILVSIFYCSEALHSERSDRSIFFWKSLPVSDWITVLAKASIPLVVVPVMVCLVAVGVQSVMLLLSSGILIADGFSVAKYWTQLSVAQMWMLLIYHIFTAHAIWPAPVYAWLLLVSGWARRAVLLWAALPVIAISGLEFALFRTSHFAMLIGSRLIGAAPATAFTPHIFPTNSMVHLTPLHFLFSMGLWIGIAVTVAFLAAAVRLRRSRMPM